MASGGCVLPLCAPQVTRELGTHQRLGAVTSWPTSRASYIITCLPTRTYSAAYSCTCILRRIISIILSLLRRSLLRDSSSTKLSPTTDDSASYSIRILPPIPQSPSSGCVASVLAGSPVARFLSIVNPVGMRTRGR